MSYHGYDLGDRNNWYQSPSIGPMRQGPPELSVAAAQYRVSPGFAPTRTTVLDGSSAQPTGTYTGFSLYSHSYTPQIPPPQYYPPSPPSQSFTQNPQFHTQISSIYMVDSTHSVSPIHSHMTHSVYSLPQTPNHLFYTTSQPLQHPRNFHSPCQHPPTPSEIYQHYPPTQPHFIPTNQFAPPPPAYEQQRPISLAPDRVHENQMDPRILEMQDSFEAIRARQSSFRAQILEELGQLHLGPKAPVTESASSPLKFGSLPAGSVTLTVANGSSSTLSASSRGIPISEKPNLKLSPHEVTLGLNKNFTTAFVNGNHSEHTTTAVMTEELVLNVDKNIARGFTGVKFSDSYGGDVATSIVWRNDAQTHCFQHTSFRDGSAAGYGELVSHNHNSVGNIRVDFHEREEKELEDAYGEDDNEDEGENDSTESYVDGESYSDDFQSVDGQIVTDSDEEVVTDDEGSRPCIKKEALLEIMYQSKDPKSLDEAEMLENLFNCLCGLLMPLENKDINAGIKEETSKRDVGDSSLGVVSLEPLKLIEFAKQVAEQLFGRADILELVGVCAIFISAFVLVGTHDQLFSYYKSRLIKHLKELGHVFDIKGQMEMTNKHYENLLKEKDQHRDIASIATTQSFTQSILVSILLQLIKGSTVLGVNTEMKCECLDILCNVLRKFGNIMATDHELCSESSTIVVDRSCCCSLIIVCAHELQTAKGTRESHCLELEVNAKEAKLKLQRKLNELESLLTGSEKNENEFEASLESVSGKWKHKQGSFQSFVDYQAGALTELNAALPSTRREILSAKQSHSEEFNCMGSKLGGLADAPEKYHVVLVEKVFARRPEVSVVSWNVMITGYSLIFQNQKAIEYLPRIQTRGVGPDEVTHINLPAACVKSGDIKSGRQMSDNISRPNVMSVNAIISVYFQKEDHMEVIKRLREMLFRGLHLDQNTLTIALSSSALMGIFAWRTFPLSTFMILGALLISVLHAMVRLYVHKILVVIQTLWIDEGYYARVEGREMISNLSKASASKFLLNWLVQLEHEYHKWSAAISLGLILSGLLITDHKHVLEKCLGVDYFLQAATLQELVQEFVGDGIPLVLPPNIQDNEEYGGLIVNDEDVRAGVVLHDDGMMIVDDHITDGDKEPTIPLLWNMFVHLQLPLLVKKATLADETCKIQETMDGSINVDSPPIFSGFHDQALIMILYSLRLIRAWHKSMGYLPFEDSNYPTMPWFSYSFLGLGVTLCSGHIAADTANGYGFQMISCKGAQILIQNMKLEDKFV